MSVISGVMTLYMAHGDIELDPDYAEDEIHRAQSEISSEHVEECTSPSIYSPESDPPV